MEVLWVLLVLGCISPSYLAEEIEPVILPRNLEVICKICDGIHSIFDGLSYDDYDFWRTIDIEDKLRLFCSFCKKRGKPSTTPVPTESSTPQLTTKWTRVPGSQPQQTSSTESPTSSSLPVKSTTQSTSSTESPTSSSLPVKSTTQSTTTMEMAH